MRVYLVVSAHWEYNDNWSEREAHFDQPLLAYRNRESAEAYCLSLNREEITKRWSSSNCGPLELFTSLEESELIKKLVDLRALNPNLPFVPFDVDWAVEGVLDLFDRFCFFQVIESEVNGIEQPSSSESTS